MHQSFALNLLCVCWHDISCPALSRVCEEETYNGALSHNKAPSSLFRISDIFSIHLKFFFLFKLILILSFFFSKTIKKEEGVGRPRGLNIARDASLSHKTALGLHLLPVGFSVKIELKLIHKGGGSRFANL